MLKAEQPFEHPVNLFGQPGQYGNALGGGSVVYAGGAGAEGEHDHGRGDDQHARDNLQAQFHTVLAAVQHSVQKTHEDAFLLGGIVFVRFLFRRQVVQHGAVQFGIGLEAVALHEAGADDGAAEGAEQAHQCAGHLAVADHGDDDHEAHAEGSAEVGQGQELVFLEIGSEVAVLGQGDDGGVVTQESHHRAQGGHSGEVVQGFHEGAQEALQQGNHAEFRHQFGQGSGEHGDAHEVEHGVQQQVVGRVHQRPDHVASAHPAAQEGEGNDEKGQEDDGFHRRTARFFQFHFLCGLAGQR